MTPAQVKKAPVNVSWSADSTSFYTLLMVDPDAPSRRINFLKEFNHWLVVNIKGNDLTNGTTVITYLGSMPPILSGIHRYTFLVFKQQSLLPAESISKKRWRFSTRNFIRTHNLGQPIAGNFFHAQYTK